MSLPSRYPPWLIQTAVAALYFLFGHIMHLSFTFNSIVCVFWPGSGLALAALLIGGRQYLWGIFAGSLLLNAYDNNSVWAITGITLANVLEGYLGLWLVNRFSPDARSLRTLSDYLKLVALGGGAAGVGGAFIGAVSIWLAAYIPPNALFENFLHWWMGDTLGVVLLTPFLLALRYGADDLRGKPLESLLLTGMTLLVGQGVFLGWLDGYVSDAPRGYWLFLCIAWVAIRLGVRGTIFVLLLVSIQALTGAYLGVGFFANDIAKTELHNYWSYMLILTLVGMALTTYVGNIHNMLRDLQLKDSALDAAANGIVITDPDGRIQWANRAFSRVSGYRLEEAAGHNPRDLVKSGKHEEAFYRNMWETILAQKVWHGEIVNRRKDGSLYDEEMTITPVCDRQGNITNFVAVKQEIGERKRAEAAQRENEEKLRGLYELSPLGIALTDMNGRYLEFNQAFEKICGYPMEELNQLDYWALTPKKYADDEARQLESLHSTGHYGPYEKEYIRKDGSLIPIRLNGLLLTDRDGKQYIWSIVEDITEHVQFEQELKRSNAELEQFSYAASHDMRQPLRMISSYLQLLEEELGVKLTPEQREYFGFAVDGAQRMDRMLHGMLEYSRVGRKSEAFTWRESRTLLDEAMSMLKKDIGDTRAVIEVEGDWPRIWVSRDEIVRLLQNLVGNALKYRKPGHAPHIRIAGKIENRKWRLCVADDGIGMDPNQAGRLFQMFQRLHARNQYEGSGIGLALCRRIAEHHGGRVWAESAGHGKGSSFCVEIEQNAGEQE